MNQLERVMLAAAKQARQGLRAEAAAMREAEAKMIGEAVAAKVAMPEHYWLARYQAEEKARAADRLVEALRP